VIPSGSQNIKLKFDAITIGMFVTALFIPIIFSLYTANLQTLLPTIFMVVGFTLYMFYSSGVERGEALKPLDLMIWSSVAFAFVMIAGSVSQAFAESFTGIKAMQVSYTQIQGIMYAVHLAVAEEMLFRVGLLSFFLAESPSPILAIVADAAVFSLSHIVRYGFSPALAYVFGAGLVLAYVVYRTGTPSPAIIAHVLNNLIAAGVIR
jgi:membrane protease YdiL (CAAX protease family)